jgi:cobaltochelatase CobS
MSNKIKCQICGEAVHLISRHLEQAHPHITLEQYEMDYPGSPVVSVDYEVAMQQRLAAKQQEQKIASGMHNMVAKILPFVPPNSVTKKPMHEVFELPLDDNMRSPPRKGQTQGDAIMIDVMEHSSLTQECIEAIPEINAGYVFRPDELKDLVMAIQLNIPTLVWGYHGAGKTTVVEQVCARLGRPYLRIQHTDTTEESHIVGQMVVRNGATEFDYGPLAEAMMRGWVYLADEYDFAHPAVIAVYQAVLEGKPLYIKEAPPSQRLVKPHPHFRFIATGNTNGSGDDTGLYSGTKIGNAAAYSRFGITIHVDYPEAKTEIAILKGSMPLTQDVAEKLVDFAGRIRTMYGNGEISLPISPRELIRAATIGVVKGGNFRRGIELAYSNRLDKTQSEAVSQTAQRIFG